MIYYIQRCIELTPSNLVRIIRGERIKVQSAAWAELITLLDVLRVAGLAHVHDKDIELTDKCSQRCTRCRVEAVLPVGMLPKRRRHKTQTRKE